MKDIIKLCMLYLGFVSFMILSLVFDSDKAYLVSCMFLVGYISSL